MDCSDLQVTELPAVPRICWGHLDHSIYCEEWQAACESLSISLSRFNVAIITMNDKTGKALNKTTSSMVEVFDRPPSDKARLRGAGCGYSNGPGEETYRVRLGSAALEKLGAAGQQNAHKVYAMFDRFSRTALRALCRSCHLRLRGDTFTPILDDEPPPRDTVSSSVLAVRRCSQDMLACSGQPTVLALGAEQQYSGMLALVTAHEAMDRGMRRTSMMQVKAAGGKWIDLTLGPNDVAVFVGRTAECATGGLLETSTYRVVGDPTAKGHMPRWCTCFELNARPSAVLDFSEKLRDAGHEVHERYQQPVGMRELMHHFDEALTPLSSGGGAAAGGSGHVGGRGGGGPRRRASDASDVAGGGGGGGSLVSLETYSQLRRGKKRSVLADLNAATEGPVTRSAGVRRSTEGGGGQAAEGRGGGGAGGVGGPAPGTRTSRRKVAGRSSAEGGAAPAPKERQMCVLLTDGYEDEEDEEDSLLNICCEGISGPSQLWFRLGSSTRCGRMFESYCSTMGLDLAAVKFMFNGVRVVGHDTIAALGMTNASRVVVMPVGADVGAPMSSKGWPTSWTTAMGDEDDDHDY